MKKILLTLSALFPATLLAGNIPVYNQPQANAQVIGQINTDSNITPIFKKSGWIEVVDKNTGQTGWLMQNPPSTKSSYQTEYHHMLRLIRQEQASLKEQYKQAKSYFKAKMQALHEKESALMSRIQGKSNNSFAPMMTLSPAAKSGSVPNKTYTAQSTTITCNGKNGTKIVKKVWLDKNGQQRQTTTKSKITC